MHQVRTVRDAIQRYRDDHDIKPTLKTDDQHVLDWWSSRLGDKRLSLTPVDDGHHLLSRDIYDVRESYDASVPGPPARTTVRRSRPPQSIDESLASAAR